MADFRDNPTFGLPSRQLKLDSGGSGGPNATWYQFFTRMAQLSAERPIEAVSVGAAPFVYKARTIGHIFITGGTVSSITLRRSGVALAVPSDIFIPVAANDTITITHSAAPDMTFIPSARA